MYPFRSLRSIYKGPLRSVVDIFDRVDFFNILIVTISNYGFNNNYFAIFLPVSTINIFKKRAYLQNIRRTEIMALMSAENIRYLAHCAPRHQMSTRYCPKYTQMIHQGGFWFNWFNLNTRECIKKWSTMM